MKNPWYFINSGICEGKFNMDFDNNLLIELSKGLLLYPILRIYGWDITTVSIGSNQRKSEVSSDMYIKYPIVQRITGGQMVLHRPPDDEITYSVCIKHGFKSKELYLQIGTVLLEFLKAYKLTGEFGYDDKNYLKHLDCFSSKTSADIVVNKVKVIGSAQYRKKDYILQHGAIMLDKISRLTGVNITFNSAAYNLKKAFQDKLKIDFMDYPIEDQNPSNMQLSKV